MGNNTIRPIRFLQSASDFPLVVHLDRKAPAWGLSRWQGNRGLRFIPDYDEGFALRGDRRQLLYKGRKQSHRFTILGDGAFEYDCILNREPENNVITLKIEGAEDFDFFRQPDFIKDPYLAGSYAVYKKTTFIGEGTGKLCHIHRPKIIDAAGRWVWGDVTITGDTLSISIPEQWLGEAKYPVIVDPTIGTTTVGSLDRWWDWDDEFSPLEIEMGILVNKFLVNEPINGLCNAHVYSEHKWRDIGCYPCIYSDYGGVPLNRLSCQESFMDFTKDGPGGWEEGTFQVYSGIPAGSSLWFGFFICWIFYPRYDYGAKCYWESWEGDVEDIDNPTIPDVYPLWKADEYHDFKLSMYFTYTATQQHLRTLTQGVRLFDTEKRIASFKREAANQVRTGDFFSSTIAKLLRIFDLGGIEDKLSGIRAYYRGLYDTAGIFALGASQAMYSRVNNETVHIAGLALRHFLIFVKLVTVSFVRDYLVKRFLKAREELDVKSPVCRELILESRIH
jgi:hypothetical protein